MLYCKLRIYGANTRKTTERIGKKVWNRKSASFGMASWQLLLKRKK